MKITLAIGQYKTIKQSYEIKSEVSENVKTAKFSITKNCRLKWVHFADTDVLSKVWGLRNLRGTAVRRKLSPLRSAGPILLAWGSTFIASIIQNNREKFVALQWRQIAKYKLTPDQGCLRGPAAAAAALSAAAAPGQWGSEAMGQNLEFYSRVLEWNSQFLPKASLPHCPGAAAAADDAAAAAAGPLNQCWPRRKPEHGYPV